MSKSTLEIAPAQANAPVQSMTGFSSVEGTLSGQKIRVEMKTLNHRFLDVKMRLPREFSAAEMPFRAAVQAKFARGSLDVKVERIQEPGTSAQTLSTNLELAQQYHTALLTLQKKLGLTDTIRTLDIALHPEVISRSSSDFHIEDPWAALEPLAQQAMTRLAEMRIHEGQALKAVLQSAIDEMNRQIALLRERRSQCQAGYPQKIREKIKAIFEAYPIVETSIQAVVDSRLSQELSILADRTDVEEELIRFKGHLDHFTKILNAGGQVGRKLDFILQELGREINTLGNKAQDFSIGEEVVQIKVKLEQIREQVMNLE